LVNVDDLKKHDPPEHRSVSQYNVVRQCPYRYFLERVVKVWSKPAAWFPQGTAVHYAAEVWEKSGRTMSLEDVKAEYSKAFAEAVNKMLDETPNTDFWYSSGPYDGLADIERRFQIGLEQVERYIDYYARVPDEVIWVDPDGKPAIELEFEVDYDGVKVKGFIDQVVKYVLNREGAVKPRDVKTGNEPSGEFQLATYADYLQQEYDLAVVEGDYLMTGKRGKKQAYIVEYDLSEWTHERLKEEYQWADDVIRNERFEPDPDPKKCHFCGVADSCIYRAS